MRRITPTFLAIVLLSLFAALLVSFGTAERAAAAPATVLEDFTDDCNAAQAAFSSHPAVAHAAARSEALVDEAAHPAETPFPTSPHALYVMNGTHTVTFPGSDVTRVAVSVETGHGVVTFVGQNDFRRVFLSNTPWVRQEVTSATIGAGGLPLGSIVALELSAEFMLVDNVEIEGELAGQPPSCVPGPSPTPPPCDFAHPTIVGDGSTIIATPGDDVIVGTAGDDVIFGQEGDDCIDGRGGNDVLIGDSLLVGGGNDVLFGGAGTDDLLGGPGDDLIDGGPDADEIYGMGGIDTIDGRDGDDEIDGGRGDDAVVAGTGMDKVYAGDGADSVSGGDDADTLFGQDGDDELEGGDGDDRLDGGRDQDRIDGGLGTDTIFGGYGDDTAFGGDDPDTIWGQQGADDLDGGAGVDTVNGGSGTDACIGESLVACP